MVSLKSNKSNLNRKNPIFFIHLKINHDLYQPYSAKILTKEALRWDTIFLFIQSVVFYTNVSCISLEHVMNHDALIG